jgi:hypothetical protein
MGTLLSDGSGIVACLRNCRLETGVFAKPFHSNGCLCWLHNSGFQQTYHSTLLSTLWLWTLDPLWYCNACLFTVSCHYLYCALPTHPASCYETWSEVCLMEPTSELPASLPPGHYAERVQHPTCYLSCKTAARISLGVSTDVFVWSSHLDT